MKIPVYTGEQFQQMENAIQETHKPFVPEEGVYDFIIKEAEDTISKAGNETTKLKLLANVSNKDIFIYDWVTLLPHPGGKPSIEDKEGLELYNEALRKHKFSVEMVKKFLECLKIPYAEDSMQPRNLINKEGKVLLKPEYNKEKQRSYLRRDMYMTEELLKKYYQEQGQTAKPTEDFDDDIPF